MPGMPVVWVVPAMPGMPAVRVVWVVPAMPATWVVWVVGVAAGRLPSTERVDHVLNLGPAPDVERHPLV